MAKKEPDPPVWLLASEAAALLHVSAKTIGRWAREGRVPYQKTMGGHRRYPEAELRAILAGHTIEATDPPDLS